MRLNACLALALPLTGLAATPLSVAGAYSFGFASPGLHAVGRPPLATVVPGRSARPRLTQHVATTRLVTNCNDSGDGSLRAAANIATDGDLIDMTGLACAVITLTTGQINLSAENVTLAGPTQRTLYVEANHDSRQFRHYGHGILGIYDLKLVDGNYGDFTALPGAVGKGGCVYSSGSIVFARSHTDDCRIYAPAAAPTLAAGGALAAEGYVLLDHSTIVLGLTTASNATALGGAIFAATDVYLIHSFIVSANVRGSVLAKGGAIYAYGNAVVDSSTITYCSAGEYYDNFATPSYGGAIYVAGSLSAAQGTSITRSTISNNHARNVAGVEIVHFNGTYTATVTDSTISGNVAVNRVGGMVSTMPLFVRNSTIAFNTAGTSSVAAGLEAYNNTVDLQSTIIARNYSPGPRTDFNVASSTVSGSNNLIMLSPVAPPSGIITTDPQLNALANNGGPTRTHSLKASSPAIGQGNHSVGEPYDQRGPTFPRVVGGTVDIGAVEYNTDFLFASGFELSI